MYRAEDYKAGKGITGKKPHTSVLPFLRAQEAEKAEAGKKPASPTHTDTDKESMTPQKEETYNEARRSILAGK